MSLALGFSADLAILQCPVGMDSGLVMSRMLAHESTDSGHGGGEDCPFTAEGADPSGTCPLAPGGLGPCGVVSGPAVTPGSTVTLTPILFEMAATPSPLPRTWATPVPIPPPRA